MAHGRTRKITRKQARSYVMSTPNRAKRGRKRRASANGMGVTTMAIVNGRSASYRSRYAKARSFLKAKRARRNGPLRELNEAFDAQMDSAREKNAKKRKLHELRLKNLEKARKARAKKGAKRPGAKAASKKLTKKQLRALRLKNLEKARAARKRGAKKTSAHKAGKKPSKKASAKRTTKSPKKRSKSMARKTKKSGSKRRSKKTKKIKHGLYFSVRPARRRRKKKAAAAPMVAATPNRRKGKGKSKGKGKAKKRAARRRAKRSYWLTVARKNKGAHKGRKGRKGRKGGKKKHAKSSYPHFYMKMPAKGKRRSHKFRVNPMYHANGRRRHARRNGIGASLLSNMKLVVQRGLPVTAGFALQRVLSHVVAEKGLASISTFQSGAVGENRKIIAQLVVAPIAVMAVAKLAPKYAIDVAIGAGASIGVALLQMLAAKSGSAAAVQALSAYPDAPGVAFHTLGSYEYTPVAGFGDYYEQYSGHPMLEQAAAGLGAAGIQQAAAGYPLLQQAAAGTGEYVAQSVSGFGDYEMLNGLGSSQAISDGVHPDHAEQALTVAEAAAGVGDFPLEPIVFPGQVPAPIEDAPQGSRAGTFSGREGIFG